MKCYLLYFISVIVSNLYISHYMKNVLHNINLCDALYVHWKSIAFVVFMKSWSFVVFSMLALRLFKS